MAKLCGHPFPSIRITRLPNSLGVQGCEVRRTGRTCRAYGRHFGQVRGVRPSHELTTIPQSTVQAERVVGSHFPGPKCMAYSSELSPDPSPCCYQESRPGRSSLAPIGCGFHGVKGRTGWSDALGVIFKGSCIRGYGKKHPTVIQMWSVRNSDVSSYLVDIQIYVTRYSDSYK